MRLVTLHPLPLGSSRSEVNMWRQRHGLRESIDSSFFEMEEVQIGEACQVVSWSEGGSNKKQIKVFKYTRVNQTVNSSVLLCCNPTCKNAVNDVKISATVENEEGLVVLNRCGCGFEAIDLRSRKLGFRS